MNSKMDPMGRAIADYWNALSSESRQARLDGRVATSKDEVKTRKADRLHKILGNGTQWIVAFVAMIVWCSIISQRQVFIL